MKMDEGGTTGYLRRLAGLGVLLVGMGVASAGCTPHRASIAKGLMVDRPLQASAEASEQYRVACPDAIEIVLPDKTELSGQYVVGPDGRIDLGDYGKLRVEGRTPPEIAQLLATETGSDAAQVQVGVLAYRSQSVFLFGQVIGWQKAVPYRGQETVVELLQRVGGIARGAAPNEVYVVRPHVESNQRPELFKVDLQAIVLKRDESTNIRLLPFDQVYVGETQQAVLERVIPPWLRPLYRTVTRSRK